jgi:hypothetical protein
VSGAHPASYPMGTGGPFPGSKARPGRDADHSPHLVPWSRMSRSCIPPPLTACMAVAGQLFLCNRFNGLYSLTSESLIQSYQTFRELSATSAADKIRWWWNFMETSREKCTIRILDMCSLQLSILHWPCILIFAHLNHYVVDPSGRAVKGVGLWPLGCWVRILLEVLMFVSCLCVVLSCVGRGLCDGRGVLPCVLVCVITETPNNNNNNNNNVRSSIRNIGCLQIFSSLLGSWR